MTHYHKVRFTSRRHGATAGIILETATFGGMTLTQVSRFFPWSEVPKMEKLEQAGPFESWDEAFEHQFKS